MQPGISPTAVLDGNTDARSFDVIHKSAALGKTLPAEGHRFQSAVNGSAKRNYFATVIKAVAGKSIRDESHVYIAFFAGGYLTNDPNRIASSTVILWSSSSWTYFFMISITASVEEGMISFPRFF